MSGKRRDVRAASSRWPRLCALLAWLFFAAVQPASYVAAQDELDSLDSSASAEAEATGEAPPAADGQAATAEPAHQVPAPKAPAAEPVPAGASVVIEPFAGAGFSTRSFTRPTSIGVQALSTSFVPGAEAGLAVTAWPDADFSLAFLLHYQTALGLTVTERPAFALPNEVPVRSERIELSVAPGWRLGTGPKAARLSIPLGGTVRTLWPNVHTLMTPGYSLIGPHGRLEITLPLTAAASVRLGAEVQWIVGIDQALQREGVSAQGVALGGQVVLAYQLSRAWSLGLTFRESHALAATFGATSFTDVERYATARLSGAF